MLVDPRICSALIVEFDNGIVIGDFGKKAVLASCRYRMRLYVFLCFSAFWKAARKELGVIVRGCGFHWAQAVERHIKSLGLYSDFVKKS